MLERIDATLRARNELAGIVLLHETAGLGISDAQHILAVRREKLAPTYPEVQPPPMPTFEELVAKADAITLPIRAVEAFWDGDTQGWMVCLAVLVGHDEREVVLSGLRQPAGDMRIFDGQVPPWPEALLARRAGEAIAAEHGVPFWFPADDAPEEAAPRWSERDSAVPCEGCGRLIVMRGHATLRCSGCVRAAKP